MRKFSKAWQYSPRAEVRARLAAWYGKRLGYRGNTGGWVRHPNSGVAYHGWLDFYRTHKTDIWKALDAQA